MMTGQLHLADGRKTERRIDRLFQCLRTVLAPLLFMAILADSFTLFFDNIHRQRSSFSKRALLMESFSSIDDRDSEDDGLMTNNNCNFSLSLSSPPSAGSTNGNTLMDAFASATQNSCSILGVKSIGVDYGLVRTGVAVTVGYNPSPLEILSDLNSTQVAQRVVQICQSEQADQIIVGLPLHKNGTEAEQTNITRQFASELALQAIQTLGPNIPIYMWDERYTSKEAAARAHARNPNRELYGQLDAEAACIILENFYQESGQDSEQVEPPQEVKKRLIQLWQDRRVEHEMKLKLEQEERDDRLRWRREAMLRDRQLELENNGNSDENGYHNSGGSSKKSKKKKKQKKKRQKRGSWIVLSFFF